MTKQIPVISWQDTADQDAPVAPYTVDFVVDQVWQFGVTATYHDKNTKPRGIYVDNSANNFSVAITAGVQVLSILPFNQVPLDLPSDISIVTVSATVNVGTVPIIFFVVKKLPQQFNQFGAQTAINAAIAASSIGVMSAIINGEFRVSPQGVATAPAALTYGPEGWATNVPGGAGTYLNAQAAGIIASQNSWQVGRQAANASVAVVQAGTQIETADAYQFVGSLISCAFDVTFGANFSGALLTAEIHGGTGTDQNVFGPFAGDIVLATATFTTAVGGSRVNFQSVNPVGVNITQIGLVFKYTPVGVAGANDWFKISRVQLDVGVAQGYRPVPMEFERMRCSNFFERAPEIGTNLPSWHGVGGANASVSAGIILNFRRKRAIPTIIFSAVGHFTVAIPSASPPSLGTLVSTFVVSQICEFSALLTITRGSLAAGGQPADLQLTTAAGFIDINARM